MIGIGSSIGPYRLVSKLGEGGMGEVFKAIHVKIERRVAIKLLRPQHVHNPDAVTRFENEAVTVSLIQHPGVVQIFDCGQLEDGSSYLLMEYLDGVTLSKRLKDHPAPMSEFETVSFGFQLASALAAAHNVGVVHRDLKPGNIMLVPDPAMPDGERVKIFDFGIAKLEEGIIEVNKGRTRTGVLIGTPRYMSPEQCRGLSDLDGKADVYSLGVLLYQLLSGCLPFIGASNMDVIAKHLTELPAPLDREFPALSKALTTLVHRMLEKEKEKRPAMQEVADALKLLRDERWSRAGMAVAVATPGKETTSLPAGSQTPDGTDVDPGKDSPIQTADQSVDPPADKADLPALRLTSSAILARPTKLMQPLMISAPPGLPQADAESQVASTETTTPIPASPTTSAEVAVSTPPASGADPASSMSTAKQRRWQKLAGAAAVLTGLGLCVRWSLMNNLPISTPGTGDISVISNPRTASIISEDVEKSRPIASPADSSPELKKEEVFAPSLQRPIGPEVKAATDLASSEKELQATAPATKSSNNSALSASCEENMRNGARLRKQGALFGAISAYKAAFAECRDPNSLQELGEISFLYGNYDDSRKCYQELLELAPGKKELAKEYIKKIDICIKQRAEVVDYLLNANYDPIEDAIEKSVKVCTNDGLFYKYGRELHQAKQYQMAINNYDKYLLTAPRDMLKKLAQDAKDEAVKELNEARQKPNPANLRNPFYPQSTPVTPKSP